MSDQLPSVREAAPAGADPERHRRLRRLVHVLDSSFRVPFTERRFGWDAVLGVVPGLGDASGLVLSGAVVAQAVGLGARGWTLVQMVLRAVLDAVVGSVPVAGTVFDVAYRANERNLALLDRHLEDPTAARAGARRSVLGTLVGALAVIAAVVGLLLAASTWVITRIV